MIDLITAVERIRTQTLEMRHPPRVRSDAAPPPDVDARKLESALRARLDGEVRFDDGSRALYSTDSSNYRQIPIGVVIPKHVDDVVAAIEVCRKFGAPVTSRGGGTGLCGQTCNVAVIIDHSKYVNQLLELDPENKYARVRPGIVLDELRNRAERYQLTFGPDPATHNHCTIGGMIGNNSCGMHAQMAGKVEENIEELEVLTYDGLRMRVGATTPAELDAIIAAGGRRGAIYAKMKALRDEYAHDIRARFPNIPRRVSGYNLNELLPENGFNVARALVGSEGTLVTVLEAKCRLIWSPPVRKLVVFGFDDIFIAGDNVPVVNRYKPLAVEGLDQRLIEDMKIKKIHPRDIKLLPDGKGWLMVEVGGATEAEALEHARELMAAFERREGTAIPSMKLVTDEWEEQRLWLVRESGLGATAKIPEKPETHPGWEDSAVPPERLGDYLRDLRKLFDRHGYDGPFYGHFGQACIHTRVDFDLVTAQGIENWKRFLVEAAELIRGYNGSLSGEHGDGQAKAWLLPVMFGERIVQAFRDFKSIWDPAGKMNPGKVVDPYAVDENLRLGVNYDPIDVRTHFAFRDDHGNFAAAADRCVGVGQCRRHDGGVMCPSYMATHEEKHSTRGRARMLFEMLQGNPLRHGWKDRAVFESLDLCLSCKGCKNDCPVNVDMAAYKAEFLSHYYEGRLRPVHAYAFGLMPWLVHLGSCAPDVANLPTQTPVVRELVKKVIGVAPERRIPPLARKPFRAWYRNTLHHPGAGPQIILWPDTWNNYFHPETAQAALEVLELAGFDVIVPAGSLCCGRPLYDYGMLGLAKTLLREILDTLRPHIRAGVPLVGLEPSCISVFKDEMRELLPYDEDARRLANQTYMLGDFLSEHAKHVTFPKLDRKAIVHRHCHHRSVLGFDSEERLLRSLNLDVDLLESGCCGMAGAFGFERGDHYDVSVKCGERVLLPKIREASPETLIVNDGFSCREQIGQLTSRRALHLSQVIKMAYDAPPREPYPERRYTRDPRDAERRAALQSSLGAAALAGSALLTGWLAANARGRR